MYENASMNVLSRKFISSIIKPRTAESHKGIYGHAMIIAGSVGKMGAAIIASRACLRAGVGLLTACIPDGGAAMMHVAVPEAMVYGHAHDEINFASYSAVGAGPGIGTDRKIVSLLTRAIEICNKPLVLDADALNIIAQQKNLLDALPAGTILTPHNVEFDRLFGEHAGREERITTAMRESSLRGIVIVLKGHQTIICGGGEVFQNSTGNAGLAKGGSGDALTGIITSFAAQGYTTVQAAILGVFLHGLAADITLQSQSAESMLITDVIEKSGDAFKLIHHI